jgi:hypothetical protein
MTFLRRHCVRNSYFGGTLALRNAHSGQTRCLCWRAGGMGALGGIRTPNLLIRSQMLYPLSYERSGLAESNRSHCTA